MLSHRLPAASLAAAALFWAQPASACRVPTGYPKLSFVMASAPMAIPEGAVVAQGRFLNAGPEFDRFLAELPVIPGEPVVLPDSQIEIAGEMFDRYLVGTLVSDTGAITPIYDGACSDADPKLLGPVDQRAWIVGWFVDVGDVQAFELAPRDRTGGWGNVYDKPLGNPRATR